MASSVRSFVVLTLLLAACGDDDDASTDAGPGADGGAPVMDGSPGFDVGMALDAARPPPDCVLNVRDGILGSDGGTLLIGGVAADGSFEQWIDGTEVPYIWGFQGGTMVMPVLRIEGSPLTADPICVHADLANAFTDPGEEIHNPGFLSDVEITVRDGGYETDPIFDLIHYDSPEGRALSLTATVGVGAWSVTGTVDVVIGPEGELTPPPG